MSLKSTRVGVAFALVSGLVVACDGAPMQGSQNPSAVAEPETMVRTGNVQGPIASTLSGPAVPRLGEDLLLTVRINRHLLADSAEVSVQLTLPEEVSLQRGELHTRVLPDAVPITELRYALRTDVLPAEDVIFTVTAAGEGFGYHAALAYGFGRESALPSAPQRDASAVRVAERNFGAAVPITRLP